MPEEGGAATQTDFSARHEADFQNLHRNKRSMTLNLKDAEGAAILRRMVERADIIVENYRPDVKTRLGIDYEALSNVNPRLIYASISGFGQDGPYSDRPGVDQIAQGMSGLMSVTGEPGQGPMRVGTALADLSAGVFAAMEFWWRSTSAGAPAAANGFKRHFCKHRFLCSTSRPPVIWFRARLQVRPGTIIRPAAPTGVFRPRTAT